MTGGATRVHASCVAIGGSAVLIRGPSGSGKSSLALRLIDDGAILVADDQTLLEDTGGVILARAPATIRGRIEVRGLGIVELAHEASAPLRLIVDLAPAAAIARLPEPETLVEPLLGQRITRIVVDPGAADAAARVHVALRFLAAEPRPLVSPSEQC